MSDLVKRLRKIAATMFSGNDNDYARVAEAADRIEKQDQSMLSYESRITRLTKQNKILDDELKEIIEDEIYCRSHTHAKQARQAAKEVD